MRELRVAGHGIRAWWCRLSQPMRPYDELAASLSDVEHARAARFRTEALRRRYVIGRATLRETLAIALGIAPADVPIVRGARGRPALEGVDGLDFNVSHTRDGALIAHLAHASDRIGVDVEHEERRPDVARLAHRVMAAQERDVLATLDERARTRRFLRLWTCKEAMSKATGDGLRAPFRDLVIEGPDAAVELRHGPSPYRPEHWSLQAIALPDGYLGTIARWRRPAPPER